MTQVCPFLGLPPSPTLMSSYFRPLGIVDHLYSTFSSLGSSATRAGAAARSAKAAAASRAVVFFIWFPFCSGTFAPRGGESTRGRRRGGAGRSDTSGGTAGSAAAVPDASVAAGLALGVGLSGFGGGGLGALGRGRRGRPQDDAPPLAPLRSGLRRCRG